MSVPSNPDVAAIETEIVQIRAMGIARLRSRWCLAFGKTPPKGLTKDLLGRMIAYRLQEDVFGGLDRATAQLLDRLAGGGKPNADLNRRFKSGTVLVREYQGERHTVTVVSDGYVWRERTFSSLSTIARAITGTPWNGPRFFGLRVPAKEAGSEKAASVSSVQKQQRRITKRPQRPAQQKSGAAGTVRRHVRRTS